MILNEAKKEAVTTISRIIADFHARGKSKELSATIRKWETENADYHLNEGTEGKKQCRTEDRNRRQCICLIAMLNRSGSLKNETITKLIKHRDNGIFFINPF